MQIATGEIEGGRVGSVVGEGCRKKHYVLSATANERPPALHAVALAKNPSQVFHSVSAMNVAELADAAAIFVVVRVKSNLRGSQ